MATHGGVLYADRIAFREGAMLCHPTAEYVQPDNVLTDSMQFYVHARDYRHAIKICNDHRVQMIAASEWTLDFREWHRMQLLKKRAAESVDAET